MPDRLDDAQLAAVVHIASLPAPVMKPSGEEHFLRCMRMLEVLPHRKDDDLSGELRLALYRRHFIKWPEAAWSFLVEHATLECRFFPNPAECDALFKRWPRADVHYRAHQLAKNRARQEWQTRFDETMRAFRFGEMTQAQVDALPEQWKRIAATQGFLWEGTYQLRPSAARAVPRMQEESDAH